jgi:hypothetical protein
MTPGQEKGKRWRIWPPRFSIRTLLIFVTLICVYIAAWELTKRYGVSQLLGQNLPSTISIGPADLSPTSPIPFVVARYEYTIVPRPPRFPRDNDFRYDPEKRYYLWVYRSVVPLPFGGRFVTASNAEDGTLANPEMRKFLKDRFERLKKQ